MSRVHDIQPEDRPKAAVAGLCRVCGERYATANGPCPGPVLQGMVTGVTWSLDRDQVKGWVELTDLARRSSRSVAFRGAETLVRLRGAYEAMEIVDLARCRCGHLDPCPVKGCRCPDCAASTGPESHDLRAWARLRAGLGEDRAREVLELLDAHDAAQQRAEEAETRCSSMVSARDLTIRDLRAEVAELRADRLKALRIADALTLDTQSLSEAVASLVEMVRKTRDERDEALLRRR